MPSHRSGRWLAGSAPNPARRDADVLAELPDQAEPPPVFAVRVLKGDSHALDDGTRLSTLTLRAPGDPPRTAPESSAYRATCALARASPTTTCRPPFS
ncbi:TIGR02679 domain-containing protein [Streptomyces coacervatus]|uniref:TIGR02679 domain-containing protein n=1 Tax=Streptomyces coacervatus TaxID=647381 RepID=UPI0023DB4B8F|nr:TIGR02679 domain-containing protein [Streptomyces coacervatus]MDF2263974.1 TIGR02679 domain-containing protein [Streptomyces coacervatus]